MRTVCCTKAARSSGAAAEHSDIARRTAARPTSYCVKRPQQVRAEHAVHETHIYPEYIAQLGLIMVAAAPALLMQNAPHARLALCLSVSQAVRLDSQTI